MPVSLCSDEVTTICDSGEVEGERGPGGRREKEKQLSSSFLVLEKAVRRERVSEEERERRGFHVWSFENIFSRVAKCIFCCYAATLERRFTHHQK